MTRIDSVGVAILTYQAHSHLERCLPPLRDSPIRPSVLVVDSSSDDGTVEKAKRMGAKTLVIPRRDFNHGATRELARQRLSTDVVVMVTQDAYARDQHALGLLVEPILDNTAAVSYGRQVPRPGAGTFESFLRRFNYPEASSIRGLEDAPRYGAYLSFCSNAFAAWRQGALDEIGGFRTTLSHEDAIAAALLLKAGHRIAYIAEAVVEHSHRYSLARDFKRYFDAGYARTEYADALALGGTHRAVGARYTLALLQELLRSRPWHLPYGVAHVLTKGLGYVAGARSVGGPEWIGRRLSGQPYFWSSIHYRSDALHNADEP